MLQESEPKTRSPPHKEPEEVAVPSAEMNQILPFNPNVPSMANNCNTKCTVNQGRDLGDFRNYSLGNKLQNFEIKKKKKIN